MIGMGSPLPRTRSIPSITYLSQQYSDSTPAVPPARIPYAQALAQVQPTTAEIPPQGARPIGVPPLRDPLCRLPRRQCARTRPGSEPVGSRHLAPSGRLPREVVRTGRHRMPGFQLILKPEQEKDILAWLQSKRFRIGSTLRVSGGSGSGRDRPARSTWSPLPPVRAFACNSVVRHYSGLPMGCSHVCLVPALATSVRELSTLRCSQICSPEGATVI